MSYRHISLIPLVVLFAVAVARPCTAQSPPQGLDLNIVNASQLDANQRQVVNNYADFYTGLIANPESAAADVERGRKELIRPLLVPGGPSATFLLEYSSVVVPSLDAAIQAVGRPHAAINSLIVLGRLPDRRALTALYRHANSRNEPRLWIRIGAANNLAQSMKRNLNTINPREVPQVIRNLRDAAKIEDNPIVVRHLLEGMTHVNTVEAHKAMLESLNAVIDKIDQHEGADCPLLDPLYATMEGLRNRFIRLNLPPQDQAPLRTQLTDCMSELLQTSLNKWDAAHADPDLSLQWAKAVRLCEAILKISASGPNLNGVNTDLRRHWDNTDQPQYAQDVDQWRQIAVAGR